MTSARPAVRESLCLGHRFERLLQLQLAGASWWSCWCPPAGSPNNGSSGKASGSSTTWFGTNRSIAGVYENWGADLPRETITSFQRHFFQNAAQIRLWTALRVRDVCSTRRFVREFCQAVAGRAANFPTAFRQSFPQLCRHTVCTPVDARHREIRNQTTWAG